jgi:hypothetical protein
MPKLNFDIDEATLLKTYKISTLSPKYVVTCIQAELLGLQLGQEMGGG